MSHNEFEKFKRALCLSLHNLTRISLRMPIVLLDTEEIEKFAEGYLCTNTLHCDAMRRCGDIQCRAAAAYKISDFFAASPCAI